MQVKPSLTTKRPHAPEPQPRVKVCKHEFKHLETIKTRKTEGYNDRFTKIDRFYCIHCLTPNQAKTEESAREKPEWF